MLQAYGPGCEGKPIDAKIQLIPDGAAWVDLEEPTHDEEALVERCIKMNVPTQSEMAEIEPSSRLYANSCSSSSGSNSILNSTTQAHFGIKIISNVYINI